MSRESLRQQNVALEELKEVQCGWSCIIMEGHFHFKDIGELLKDF